MKKINSLSELLLKELADLLNMENRLVGTLSKMEEASQLYGLKRALQDHLNVTRNHLQRLRDLFDDMGQNPREEMSPPLQEIFRDIEEVIGSNGTGPARDVELIRTARRIERFEMDAYQSACKHAAVLGHTQTLDVLQKTLEEEKVMNFFMNELEQYMINVQAIDPKSFMPKNGGFYPTKGAFARKGVRKKSGNADIHRFSSG